MVATHARLPVLPSNCACLTYFALPSWKGMPRLTACCSPCTCPLLPHGATILCPLQRHPLAVRNAAGPTAVRTAGEGEAAGGTCSSRGGPADSNRRQGGGTAAGVWPGVEEVVPVP